MSELKRKVVHSVIWRVMERFASQMVQFSIGIVLARILGPEDYGTIALLGIFLVLSGVLLDSGFSSALIQKKDTDAIDFSSVFYLNIFIGCVLYAILFYFAPLIAEFYNKPILVAVLRVSALIVIINSIGAVQITKLKKELRFDLSFRITISAAIVGGVIGIALAFLGWGVWALVWSSLAGAVTSVIMQWWLIGWRPQLIFSLQRIRSLFRFGSSMLGSALLDSFFTQINGLVIGKWYSAADLAYYNRGDAYPNMVMSNVQGIIGSIAFPVLSKVQDNKETMKHIMRRIMSVSTFFVFPAMFGFAAVSKNLTLLLLTEKWAPSIPFMQLFCISYAFWPIHVANLQAIQACGRSDIFLKLEVVKKILMLLPIVVLFMWGVFPMAITMVCLSPAGVLINMSPNRKLIDYSWYDQFSDLAPSFLLALIMGICVACLNYLPLSLGVTLLLQLLFGIVLYFGLSYLFKLEAFNYLRIQVVSCFESRRNSAYE